MLPSLALQQNRGINAVTFMVILEQFMNVFLKCDSGVGLNMKQRQRVTTDW